MLLTIAIDPALDRGDALAEYARTWTTNPRAWHFLTGPLDEVKQVAAQLGDLVRTVLERKGYVVIVAQDGTAAQRHMPVAKIEIFRGTLAYRSSAINSARAAHELPGLCAVAASVHGQRPAGRGDLRRRALH